MTIQEQQADDRQQLEHAVKVLEKIRHERGVENGWLYEIDWSTHPTMSSDPTDDPRQPLVQGGPDVVLQLAVESMLDILRSALGDFAGAHDEPGAYGQAVRLARRLNEGAALETIQGGPYLGIDF